MIGQIRGALGTQVMELLCLTAYARETGDPISEININVAGNIVSTAKVDYLSKLFVLDNP